MTINLNQNRQMVFAQPKLISTEKDASLLSQAPPSQLSQILSAPSAGFVRYNGNRSRSLVAASALLEEGLQLSNTGKINQKNAWDVQIIEGMEETLTSTFSLRMNGTAGGEFSQRGNGNLQCDKAQGEGEDDYQAFLKAGNVVEGGARVWTHRVDSTYSASMQMVRRVLRSNVTEDKEVVGESEGVQQDLFKNLRGKRKRVERTLADSVNEINTEDAANEATYDIMQIAIAENVSQTQNKRVGDHNNAALPTKTESPLFTLITRKYDQGCTNGLLINNAPLGMSCNYVLDIDFSDIKSVEDTHFETHLAQASTSITLISLGNIFVSYNRKLDEALLESTNDRHFSMSTATKSTGEPINGRAISNDSLQLEVPSAVSLPEESQGAADYCASESAPVGDFDDRYVDLNDYSGSYNDTAEDFKPSYAPRESLLAQDIVTGVIEMEGLNAAIEYATQNISGVLGATACGPRNSLTIFPALSQAVVEYLDKQRNIVLFGNRSTLENIRKESIIEGSRIARKKIEKIGESISGAEATETRRKKNEKIDATGILVGDLLSVDEIMQSYATPIRGMLRPNPYRTTALTPLGRQLLGYANTASTNYVTLSDPLNRRIYVLRDYGNSYSFCEQRCKANRLLLPPLCRHSNNAVEGAEVDVLEASGMGHKPTDNRAIVPWWLPVEPEINVRIFYKPFCTESPAWACLRGLNHHRAPAISISVARDVTRTVDDFEDEGFEEDAAPIDFFDDTDLGVPGEDAEDEQQSKIGYHFDINTTDILDFSTQTESINTALLPLVNDGDSLVNYLQVTSFTGVVTVPTQIDVVKLRSTMWSKMKAIANFDFESGRSRCTLNSSLQLGMKRLRENEEKEIRDNEGTTLSEQSHSFNSEYATRLSDVIAIMLPDVPKIAKNEKLSPAFFFFSLLFLTNEQRILIENYEDNVSDLWIMGVVPQKVHVSES